MSKWVRVCSVAEAPPEGQVAEAQARDFQVCLAQVNGTLHAMENLCPHRQGPLGQGWIENGAVVCPWHAWAFDVRTGEAGYPEGERVNVYPLRIEGEDVLVDVEG